MTTSRQLFGLAAWLLALASPAAAQLLDPNAAGVRIGHMHLDTRARVAFLSDPWGTYIEVTEHLAP